MAYGRSLSILEAHFFFTWIIGILRLLIILNSFRLWELRSCRQSICMPAIEWVLSTCYRSVQDSRHHHGGVQITDGPTCPLPTITRTHRSASDFAGQNYTLVKTSLLLFSCNFFPILAFLMYSWVASFSCTGTPLGSFLYLKIDLFTQGTIFHNDKEEEKEK